MAEQVIKLKRKYVTYHPCKRGGHHVDRTGKNRPKMKNLLTPPNNPRILEVDGLTGKSKWGPRMKDLKK